MNCRGKAIKLTEDKVTVKNILLFSLGKGISTFGSTIYTFAIGLYILNVSGSGLTFAVNLSISMLPVILLMPLGGALADRWNKKSIIITTDLLNGILFLTLYLMTRDSSLSLPLLYGTTLLSTSFTVLFSVAIEASKPLLVREKKLMGINSVDKIIDSSVSILGPVMGGIVFALLNIKTFILINGISFILSAFMEVFLNFIHTPGKEQEVSQSKSLLQDIKLGGCYLRGREKIMTMIKLCIALNFFFCFSVTVPLPYLINQRLNLGSQAYGIIQGGFAVGMILGALIIKKLSDLFPKEKLILLAGVFMSFSIIFFSCPLGSEKSWLTVFYTLLSVSLGFLIVLFDLPFLYILQSEVPEEFRGRVMGIIMSVVKTVTPMAFLLSGVLLEAMPIYLLPLIGGTLLTCITLTTYKNSTFS